MYIRRVLWLPKKREKEEESAVWDAQAEEAHRAAKRANPH